MGGNAGCKDRNAVPLVSPPRADGVAAVSLQTQSEACAVQKLGANGSQCGCARPQNLRGPHLGPATRV